MRLQVLNWAVHFENDRSRKRDRCSFVCIPNKQHGVGLSTILQEPDGAAIYGVWCLLLGLLSRQKNPREGYLTVTGRGDERYLTVSELSLVWRRPKAEIERALGFICNPNIAWAIDLDKESPPSHRAVTAESPSGHLEGKGMEGNGREGKGEGTTTTPPPHGQFSRADVDRVLAEYPYKNSLEGARYQVERTLVALRGEGCTDPVGFLITKLTAWAASDEGIGTTKKAFHWFVDGKFRDDPQTWAKSKQPTPTTKENGEPEAGWNYTPLTPEEKELYSRK